MDWILLSVALVLLAFSAFLFLVALPRYLLGTRSRSGVAGFQGRHALVRLAGAACFVSTIPLTLVILFVSTSDLSLGTVGDDLRSLLGTTPLGGAFDAPLASALRYVSDILQSFVFRARWACVALAASIELAFLAAILTLVFLSRDMDRGPANRAQRNHVIELNAEVRRDLEAQES